MTLDQFITKYSGKFTDYGDAYGPQCVSLCKAYMDEVLKLGKIGTIGNVNELVSNLPNLYKGKFTTHKGLTGIQKGDLIISTSGTYGHVGIYINIPSTGKVNVFNQNGGTAGVGQEGSECRIQSYNTTFYSHYISFTMANKDELIRAIAIKCKFEAAIENLKALQKLTTQDLSPIIKQLEERLAASNNYINGL